MFKIEIFREKLPWHPLLGRNVHLDSRSWGFALQPQETPVRSVRHESYIGVLNQGDIGACTGNAACSCAYHSPFFAPASPPWQFTADEPGALSWYARNTAEDGYAGTFTYPPPSGDDTGSDSTTASKVAQEAGIISGYQMSGDLVSSLEALQDRPGITGLPWFNSMFDVGSDGLLTVNQASGLAGGHELCVDEVVAADAPGNGTGEVLVGGPNSWGTGWGAQGRWYLRASDWWALRQQQGDAFFWTAKSQPAPTPTPDPTPAVPSVFDVALWEKTAAFRHDHHTLPHIVQAAKALKTWGGQWGFDA